MRGYGFSLTGSSQPCHWEDPITTTAAAGDSQVRRIRDALSPGEWASIAGMTAFIAALHVIGWGTLLLLIAPRHYDLGAAGTFGIGLGITAYPGHAARLRRRPHRRDRQHDPQAHGRRAAPGAAS